MGLTVFVTGAGASTEFDRSNKMPVGSALAIQIEQLLSRELRPHSGYDGPISRALMRSGMDERHVSAMRRIRDGIQSKNSIDEFIHDWQEVPHLPEIAKLSIARCIFEAERYSTLGNLSEDSTDIAATLRELRESWLGIACRRLNPAARRRDVDQVFRDTAFITFNYDRCIEQFLFHSFTNTQGLTTEEARTAIRRIPIIHAYGSLGPLPMGQGGVAFGAEKHSIASAASQIRTFTENTPHTEVGEIRKIISSADKIIFLGFAYHKQNLDLLFDGRPPTHVHIFGTTLGMKPRAVGTAQAYFNGSGSRIFDDKPCSNLLLDYDDYIFEDLAPALAS